MVQGKFTDCRYIIIEFVVEDWEFICISKVSIYEACTVIVFIPFFYDTVKNVMLNTFLSYTSSRQNIENSAVSNQVSILSIQTEQTFGNNTGLNYIF